MEIDIERQEKAREYARIHRWISFSSLGVAAICIAIILGTGLDKWFRDVIQSASSWLPALLWQPLHGWYPVQILSYFLLIFLAYELLTLPLSYYSGFVLPHRYGLSVMSFKAWLSDQGKGIILSVLLEGIFISLIYALLAFQPQLWWLWAALIILFFSVLMANLAPVLIIPLFYKFTPLPEGELSQRLIALAEKAHTHVRGVFLMQMSDKTTAANAALMGLGNTRRIVLGDTMIDRYTPDEIEVVLAHELGHHVHRDIWKMIISQSILMLVGLYLANLLLHWIIDVQHAYLALTDAATIPLFLVLTALFSLVILPISNTYTRSIEYQADEYALQSTHKIAAFKSAMTRLANQNLADIEPAAWIEVLFHSHPSISKRLKHADEFASRSAYEARASLRADN